MSQNSFATLSAALDWLFANTNYEQVKTFRYNTRTFNLDRTFQVLEILGNPHLAYPTVHIAGTKGKGSTSAMTACLLQAAGLHHVGLYTSPHLMKLEERIAVNFEPIAEDDLRDCISAARGPIESVTERGPEMKPTFFEIFTIIGFLHFARKRVDAAVIEVGLGGRLDATNCVQPIVTGITPISYDHTAVLGETLDLIAREKAGIVKSGIPLVVGKQEPEAFSAIAEVAQEKQSRLYAFDRDYCLSESPFGLGCCSGLQSPVSSLASCRPPEEFAVETPYTRYEQLNLRLLGGHQRRNAAMALTMSELACNVLGVPLPPAAARERLANLDWPGRVELFSVNPPIVIDAAHNGASAEALVAALEERFTGRKAVVILAIAAHKDQLRVIDALARIAREFVVTTIDSPRSEVADELAANVRAKVSVPVHVEPSRPAALALGRKLANSDLLVITGSFYLAGELRQLLLSERASDQRL